MDSGKIPIYNDVDRDFYESIKISIQKRRIMQTTKFGTVLGLAPGGCAGIFLRLCHGRY